MLPAKLCAIARPSVVAVVAGLSGVLPAAPAAAQTPMLGTEAARVLDMPASQGVSDSATFFSALQTARDAAPTDEYVLLRALGVDMRDREFESAWQNQPDRASFHDPYGIDMWTYDVLRSWAKVQPRPAFVWTYATQAEFGYDFGEWQVLSRIAVDWARSSVDAAREAEAEALGLPPGRLRQLAIHGVIRGNILRGDGARAVELFGHLTDDRLRRDADALYRAYIGGG